MAATNNGELAFPIRIPVKYQGGAVVEADIHLGMSLRDYFAAHAPAKPAAWFVPQGVDRPAWNERGPALPHGRSERQPNGTTASVGHCKDCDAYYEASQAHEVDKAKRESAYQMAICVQWPWAYADAMIAARATPAVTSNGE